MRAGRGLFARDARGPHGGGDAELPLTSSDFDESERATATWDLGDSDAPLQVRGLTKAFGGFRAVSGVSLDAVAGQAVGLVGPNGSGKTTLINVVTGVYRPSAGAVTLRGRDVTALASHRLCRLGINRTFQIPHPLGDLSVADNIAIARARSRVDSSTLDVDPLEFVGLGGLAKVQASFLTSSEQKLLDLARALATRPDVLFIDELGAGLSTRELEYVAGLLRQLKDAGLALVIVEHLMDFLEQIVDTVVVMDAGAPIFRGTLRAAIADSRVIDVYLGK